MGARLFDLQIDSQPTVLIRLSFGGARFEIFNSYLLPFYVTKLKLRRMILDVSAQSVSP